MKERIVVVGVAANYFEIYCESAAMRKFGIETTAGQTFVSF